MNRLSAISNQIAQTQIEKPKQESKLTKIRIFSKGVIGYIALNSPKDVNSLNKTMLEEIEQAVIRVTNDEKVKVIVLCSEVPNVFSAGADIRWIIENKMDYEYGMRHQTPHQVFYAFERNRKPIIAAVNGKCFGGGFELALLCDIILATEKSYFGFPEINLGMMPGLGGTQRLAKIIGTKKAMKYILTGGGLSASEAWDLNVAEKVSSEKFEEEVHKFAESIANKAMSALILNKKAVKNSQNMTLYQGLDYEKDIFYSMFNTKAAKQGFDAFINKRKPNFKGL